MAEKEERILIEKVEVCDFGHCAGFYTEGVGEYFCVWNGERKRITENDCKNCIGISRQEAINRMAKALYAHTWKSKTPMVRVQNWEIGVTDQNKKKYLGLAEAALNALLEDK